MSHKHTAKTSSCGRALLATKRSPLSGPTHAVLWHARIQRSRGASAPEPEVTTVGRASVQRLGVSDERAAECCVRQFDVLVVVSLVERFRLPRVNVRPRGFFARALSLSLSSRVSLSPSLSVHLCASLRERDMDPPIMPVSKTLVRRERKRSRTLVEQWTKHNFTQLRFVRQTHSENILMWSRSPHDQKKPAQWPQPRGFVLRPHTEIARCKRTRARGHDGRQSVRAKIGSV